MFYMKPIWTVLPTGKYKLFLMPFDLKLNQGHFLCDTAHGTKKINEIQ